MVENNAILGFNTKQLHPLSITLLHKFKYSSQTDTTENKWYRSDAP